MRLNYLSANNRYTSRFCFGVKHKLDGRKHDVSSMRALQLMKGTTSNIFLLNKVIIFSLFRPGNSVEKKYINTAKVNLRKTPKWSSSENNALFFSQIMQPSMVFYCLSHTASYFNGKCLIVSNMCRIIEPQINKWKQ